MLKTPDEDSPLARILKHPELERLINKESHPRHAIHALVVAMEDQTKTIDVHPTDWLCVIDKLFVTSAWELIHTVTGKAKVKLKIECVR